ncbi:hypothetical protein AB3X52_05895 [Nocardioides sp. DS6]|uniref:Diacylglycerol O-acyltransferase n=1 Tax=Nocardioides eburneus TaxID=3231482 RepID=A0ABV3SW37_9ACTN
MTTSSAQAPSTAHRTAPATVATVAPSNRLTYDDELFLRMATVIGLPVVAQNAWRFPTEIPVSAVERVSAALARGPLNRLVVRSRVPGARSRFVRSSARAPLTVHPDRLSPDDVLAWLDSVAEIELDPVKGPGWALAMAYTTEGKTIVSFNVSHVVADGRLKHDSLAAASAGRVRPQLPVDDLAAAQVRLVDDLRDAAGMARKVYAGLRAARRADPIRRIDAQTSADRPVPDPQPDDDVRHTIAKVVADCPAEDWKAAAKEAGGTANGLFIAVTVEVLLAAGIVEAGRPVAVNLPVSVRGGDDDLRANATSGVTIAVDTETRDGAGVVPDLAAVRARSKEQFTALFDGTRPDPRPWFRPLVQMLPDRVARCFATNITTPLCLASNLGTHPDTFMAPFDPDQQAESILLHAVPLGATRGQLRRQRGGVTAWWGEGNGVCSLTIHGLDPDHVRDAATLRRLVGEVYARRGLTPTFW